MYFFILQGISPALENCSQSWVDMIDLFKSLKVHQGFMDIVSPDDFKYLLKAIDDARTYIKTVYPNHLEMHSSIKVR